MGTINTNNANLLKALQAQSNNTAALPLPKPSPAATATPDQGFDIVEISARALELQAAAADTGTTDLNPLLAAPAWSASGTTLQDIKAGEVANPARQALPLSKTV